MMTTTITPPRAVSAARLRLSESSAELALALPSGSRLADSAAARPLVACYPLGSAASLVEERDARTE